MRAATTRRPAFSNLRSTSPMRLRATPSGLTMEKVRSSAMRQIPCGVQKGARLYRERPPFSRKSATNPLKTNAEAAAGGDPSDREALSAATFALDVRVVEAKRLVEALLHEIDRGALDERQAFRIDEHLHALVLEHEA